jgi:hypothetical protein
LYLVLRSQSGLSKARSQGLIFCHEKLSKILYPPYGADGVVYQL